MNLFPVERQSLPTLTTNGKNIPYTLSLIPMLILNLIDLKLEKSRIASRLAGEGEGREKQLKLTEKSWLAAEVACQRTSGYRQGR